MFECPESLTSPAIRHSGAKTGQTRLTCTDADSSSTSNSLMLVPDVLALIALQMDHPKDFASFSLTCSAWYQATAVDNAYMFNSKTYNIKIEPTAPSRIRELLQQLGMKYENGTNLKLHRQHGSSLLQIHCDSRYPPDCLDCIISETSEGYWLKYFPPSSPRSSPNQWQMRLCDSRLMPIAIIGTCSDDKVNMRIFGHLIRVLYPHPANPDDRDKSICSMEKRFLSWTSVQDFIAFSCEALQSVPSGIPMKKEKFEEITHVFLHGLLAAWLDCINTRQP